MFSDTNYDGQLTKDEVEAYKARSSASKQKKLDQFFDGAFRSDGSIDVMKAE